MFKKKKVRVKRILLYIFAFSVLGLACVIYVFPTLTGALTPTSLVEYGRLRVAANETCYIIRDEAVVTATASGKIQYYLDEGELARKGTKIADVISSGSGHVTDKNILVSYYVDGYEEVFTPENMTALKKKDVESIEFTVNNVKRESAIAGEPLYKTVDNSAWYIAIWAKPENVIKYEKGKSVYVNLPLGEVKGTTYDIIDMDDSWLILLKITRFYEEMQKIRKIEAEVVTSDYEGLMVSNRSITTMEGKPGVYVKDISGEYLFTPVSVIATDGEYSLIENSFFYEKEGNETKKIKTVNVYDKILNYPEKK